MDTTKNIVLWLSSRSPSIIFLRVEKKTTPLLPWPKRMQRARIFTNNFSSFVVVVALLSLGAMPLARGEKQR